MSEQHEVDAWEKYRQSIKAQYIRIGISEAEADERATLRVRRETQQEPVPNRS